MWVAQELWIWWQNNMPLFECMPHDFVFAKSVISSLSFDVMGVWNTQYSMDAVACDSVKQLCSRKLSRGEYNSYENSDQKS